MMSDSTLLYYTIGIAMGITIAYFLFRWIFAVNKRIRQNKSIINLLIMLAKKQGATNEEIHNAVNH